MSRGISCNNPGNIRIGANKWKGKITPSRDPEFETFDCMENGIRAMGRLLLTYFNKVHLATISAIVSEYAPPEENPTAAYIMNVCDRTGFDADAPLDLNNELSGDLLAVVRGMIDQEQGNEAFKITAAQLQEGIDRVYDAP